MPAPSTAEVRIDPQFMFSNHKNAHKPRLERRQRKLLRKIPFINSFLEPDEKVLLVVPCVSPTSFLEQLTTGWIFVYVNRALLVVTNKGVFHIPTKTDYSYRHSIARFRYTDCKRLLIKGSRLLVQYANGKKARFLYLQRAPRKKLKTYFQNLALGTTNASGAGAAHLCPRCTKPLAPDVYRCPACRLPFKDMATARKLSLLLPGGGYFYTGHPFLGLGDFVVELMLLAFVIIEVGGIVEGVPGSTFGAIFFGAILAIEKLLTIHHARRYISEYIPAEKAVQPQPATA